MPRRGDERLADLPPHGGPHGDILQVRVAGTEPPRAGDGLVERRMHLARLRVDQRGDGVGVGGLELGQFAPLDDLGGDLVALGGQVFQHIRAGGVARLGLLADGQFELVEQHFLELLGAADGELLAVRQREDLLFQPGDFLAHVPADLTAAARHPRKRPPAPSAPAGGPAAVPCRPAGRQGRPGPAGAAARLPGREWRRPGP